MNEGFNTRSLLFIGIVLGGLIGGWLGNRIDHSIFGLWTTFLAVVGIAIGVFIAIKLSRRL